MNRRLKHQSLILSGISRFNIEGAIKYQFSET